jgi:uncharacterized protein (DUF362 family)
MGDLIHEISRRTFFGTSFLAAAGIGIAGCATGGGPRSLATGGAKRQEINSTSTVSLAKNSDRRQATFDSLKPLQDSIAKAIGQKQVIVKVNAGFPTEEHRIHSTYADQVRGILDFLRGFYDGNIWISEGVGSSKTGDMMDGYEIYGIIPIPKEYKSIRLVDANRTPATRKWIHQFNASPMPISIINMYFEQDKYVISAARLKTHDTVVGTYSLKNIAMGSPLGSFDGRTSEKSKMHGGNSVKKDEPGGGQELSYNMFRLALEGIYPDLAVVDGVTGIEGNGPWDGTPVEHNISVASTDFVACDRICTELMGIDPFYMKYLEWCGDAGLGNWDMKNIKIVGANLNDNIIKYKLNKSYEWQIAWIDRNFKR